MRRSSGGEIVEVEGGHIVRSTGRKDRHSKVYTSKGPRDRRVRLSAHTAIEFYDVQDRLGYDRPSKAVDWLIKKAKPSIDKLAQLPPSRSHPFSQEDQDQQNIAARFGESSTGGDGYNFHFPSDINITSSSNFQNYPRQNLGLSLHSFQDHTAGLIPWQSSPSSQQVGENETENHARAYNQQQHSNQTLFGGFENSYQRMVTWNNEATTDYINKIGFMVNSQQPFLGQLGSSAANSEYSPSENNETLQSSFSPNPPVQSWNEIAMTNSNSREHHRSQQQQAALIFGGSSRFLSDGLAGFCNIPEEHGVASNSNRLSSASPPSSHH